MLDPAGPPEWAFHTVSMHPRRATPTPGRSLLWVVFCMSEGGYPHSATRKYSIGGPGKLDSKYTPLLCDPPLARWTTPGIPPAGSLRISSRGGYLFSERELKKGVGIIMKN